MSFNWTALNRLECPSLCNAAQAAASTRTMKLQQEENIITLTSTYSTCASCCARAHRCTDEPGRTHAQKCNQSAQDTHINPQRSGQKHTELVSVKAINSNLSTRDHLRRNPSN